jgi:hypothetical protein
LKEEDDALGYHNINHCGFHGISHILRAHESIEKTDKREENYFAADIYEHWDAYVFGSCFPRDERRAA